MPMKPAEIVKRFEKAKRRKEPWLRRVNRAMTYARPRYIIETEEQLQQTHESQDGIDNVFDSTAMVALDGFVSNIQSALFPPVKSWINLVAGEGVKDPAEGDKKLEVIVATVFKYLSNSNFDTEMTKALGDFSAGVGAIMLNKGTSENPLQFTAVSARQLSIEEGAHGRIDTVYRESRVAYRSLQETWPDMAIPEAYQELVEKQSAEYVDLLEAFMPGKIKLVKSGKTKEAVVDGYKYTVIDTKTKEVLLERSQESSPWVVFRWPGLPNEVYTQGPLLKALPDILTVNKVKELILSKGSRDTFGIYTYLDDGVINVQNVKYGPDAWIPVETNGGARGPAIQLLPSGGSLEVGQFIFNDIEQKINKIMYAEPLGRIDLPVKTATEVAFRMQELARKAGSAFGPLLFELIAPLVKRILFVLDELGLIDLGGFKVDGRAIALQYQSPLALAQDSDDYMAVMRYSAAIREMYGPQVALALMPPSKFAPYIAKKLHLPKDLVPTEAEISAVMEQAAQAIAAQSEGGGAVPGDVIEEAMAA